MVHAQLSRTVSSRSSFGNIPPSCCQTLEAQAPPTTALAPTWGYYQGSSHHPLIFRLFHGRERLRLCVLQAPGKPWSLGLSCVRKLTAFGHLSSIESLSTHLPPPGQRLPCGWRWVMGWECYNRCLRPAGLCLVLLLKFWGRAAILRQGKSHLTFYYIQLICYFSKTGILHIFYNLPFHFILFWTSFHVNKYTSTFVSF